MLAIGKKASPIPISIVDNIRLDLLESGMPVFLRNFALLGACLGMICATVLADAPESKIPLSRRSVEDWKSALRSELRVEVADESDIFDAVMLRSLHSFFTLLALLFFVR